MRSHTIHWCILSFALLSYASCTKAPTSRPSFGDETAQSAADQQLAQMPLTQKVGQLLIWQSDRDELERAIHDAQNGWISGIIWPRLSLAEWRNIHETLSEEAVLPLFSGIEETISLGNIFLDQPEAPAPLSVAASASDSLETQWADLFVEQCKAYGINLVLGPHLDCPPDHRCWSNVPEVAVAHAQRLVKRLAEARIAGIPLGTGRLLRFDTSTGTLEGRWPDVARLYWSGAAGFEMEWPQEIYDYPVGFGRRYLEEAMDFGGLLVGRARSEAMLEEQIFAGADLILTDDPERDRNLLIAWIQQGRLPLALLDEKVRRVLNAKLWTQTVRPKQLAALHRLLGVPLAQERREPALLQSGGIPLQINHRERVRPTTRARSSQQAYTRLSEATWGRSIVLLQRGSRTAHIPLARQDQVAVGWRSGSALAEAGARLAASLHDAHTQPFSLGQPQQVMWPDGMLVVLLLDTATASLGRQLETWSRQRDLIILYYGQPAQLKHLPSTAGLIYVPEHNRITEKWSFEVLLGKRPALGKLPVAVGGRFPQGSGRHSRATRLNYALPEMLGIEPDALSRLDEVARALIKARAAPGCEVLVAVGGHIIWHKTWGHLTYEQKEPLRTHHLFDLASITKVAATTLAVMMLYEQGKLSLDAPVEHYVPEAAGTAVGRISLRKLLNHASNLQANMPIAPYVRPHQVAMADSCGGWYCRDPDSVHTLQIAPSLFFDSRQQDSILQAVWHLKPLRRRRYRYSDVNFVILQQVITRVAGMPLDSFVYQHFYQPLGLWSLTFRPLDSYPATAIVPSAIDRRWRRAVLRGHVHDEAAALLGGVAGHAGLFGSALDLAVLGQMLLNGGQYGNIHFFHPRTVQTFTSKSRENHRGLGFDKPAPYGKNRSIPLAASMASFGHTGFTGTMLWIDPEYELVFVFLTNRTWPDPYNLRLYRGGYRKRMMEIVYEALKKKDSGRQVWKMPVAAAEPHHVRPQTRVSTQPQMRGEANSTQLPAGSRK